MKATLELTDKDVATAIEEFLIKHHQKTMISWEPVIATKRHTDFMDRDSWTTTEFTGIKVVVEL